MSTKAAAIGSVKMLTVHWGQDVRFAPLVVHSHTETRLRTAPVTMDFSDVLDEPNDSAGPQANGRTVTGGTDFYLRESLPPAEAA